MHLSLSSDQLMTGVFEQPCTADGGTCDVNNFYDWHTSTTCER